MDIDNDILQEFLVEAGELYDRLGDQIVALEQQPDDTDLLNAIFRTFHTIKGGAGFMNLTPMVEACHRTEDIVNLLRKGERRVDAELIDVLLRVLDVLGDMFDSIRSGAEPCAADAQLLDQLQNLSRPGSTETAQPESPSPAVTDSDAEARADMDSEFDAMLHAAQTDAAEADGQTAQADPPNVAANDLITDDEFEALLDELHGRGKHGSQRRTPGPEATPAPDLITDDEFEAVLDQLHGSNGAPGRAAVSQAQSSSVTKPVTTTATVARTDTKRAPKNGAAHESPAAGAHAATAETSVRVDTARLDEIMNLVGELVLVRNRLATLKTTMKRGEVVDAISSLELVTTDLQSSVMKTRMQPIRKVFSRFPRVIRDLSRQLHKDIELRLLGEETEIDKSLVEALADPLIHLVRNAVDHGIESPEERIAAGKPAQGNLTLCAQQDGDQILLSICDDGRGMDHQVFRAKAVENGMMNEEAANNLSDTEAFNLIFAPGFSTKAEISDVSGRGVGMDVVKTRITELNGSVEINSTLGAGSVINIRLPLTLAILPTLMVELGGYKYALPLTNVNEAFNVEAEHVNVVDGQEVMRVRDQPLPLFYLRNWLVKDTHLHGLSEGHKVIVVQMGGRRLCLVVDHIIGQEEVVIKPLGAMLCTTPGFAGATITGDGGIALIIDLAGLVGAYAPRY
jgi:two-component system chemotaxis sensor kinase CheA